jgi:TonB family protein
MSFGRVLASFLLLAALIPTAIAAAEDSPTPRERLEQATAVTSLDELNKSPWHATLNVTSFDEKGQNPVEANVEYWKSGDDWKRVITAGANVETVLRHDGKMYSALSGSSLPFLMEAAFQRFLHPGPSAQDLEGSNPELRKQNFGKLSLNCIMLNQPMKHIELVPLGLFPTYCLSSDENRLQLTFDFGSRTLVINRAGRFLDHEVIIEFSLGSGPTILATVKVVSLTTFSPASDMFQPTPELKEGATTLARISSGVIQGLKLTGAQPVYPVEAHTNSITGSVTLHVVIGRDGRIETLHVVSAPDVSLALSALAAVRTWVYKPYLLNGEPTNVDTTIIVNYTLN